MRESVDTLSRQWMMLERLPRYPRRIRVREMLESLAAEGVDITPRTVQRDLERLSERFPISSETEGRANFWFWTDADRVLEIPTMGPATALAFHLARPHLEPQLPPGILEILAPYFSRATEVLHGTALERWPERVLTIGCGPALTPPEVRTEVQEVVYGALLDEHRFEVDYHSREQGDTRRYAVNPLGLVIREGVFYLVCTLWDYEDVRHLALHRMASAVLLEERTSHPPGFDLQAYVHKQFEFAYPLAPAPIRLRALFDPDAAFHLGERTLSKDQRLTERPDGWVLVEATVPDTQELRWWLLGFGDGVKVVGPEGLRGEMVAVATGMARAYGLGA